MKSVKILKSGLTEAGRVYREGEVIDDPSPALLRIAEEGDEHEGVRLAEVITNNKPSEKVAPVLEEEIPEPVQDKKESPIAKKPSGRPSKRR